MNEITIPMEEYKKLLEAQVRINVFLAYVNNEQYNISREMCASFLGFDLEEKKDD